MSEYYEELHAFEQIEQLTSELKRSYQAEINELRREIIQLKDENTRLRGNDGTGTSHENRS